MLPELPGQLTVKTSSSKKRKLSRPLDQSQDAPDSPSPDTALPSCEPDDDYDDDPSFSFSAASVASGRDTPLYVRASPQPASSLPQRLQTHGHGSLVSSDYASSAASSPSASAYGELSLDSDRGGDDTIPSHFPAARAQSPLRVTRRAMLNGDASLPHRSSSPLKRRASSMNPEKDDSAAARDGDAVMSTGVDDTSADVSDQMPRAMSVDPPATTDESDQPKPPLLEQVKVIETFLKAFAETPPKEGDVAYLVSRSWVDKALALRSNPKLADGASAEDSLGAIDNSDIIQEVIQQSDGKPFTLLKPGSDLQDFELFPEHAWNLVMSWYGLKDGQGPITRMAVNTSTDLTSEPNIIYELHPPMFQIHRLWSKLSPHPIEQQLKASNPPPLVLVRSRKYHMQTFYKELKQLAGIPIDRKFRVYIVRETKVPSDMPHSNSALTTPPDSPGRDEIGPSASDDPWSHLLIDVHTFSATIDDRSVVDAKDQTAKENYNGKATLQLHGLETDQRLVLDESIGEWFVSTYNGRSKLPSSFGSKTGTAASSRSDSGRSSPAPLGPMTRGRTQRKKGGRSLGAVGLHNLGNTCYMNSALQCVRSVEELTKYFLTDTYVSEINKSNLLGYYGKVAMAYGNLLREIYDEGRGSVSPRDFKTTVGRCRSTFSGFGQQDSQEFLGFLLDGLQEDLSRIKKKPYIEKPDSTDEMINDPEAIREMADKVWDITRKRDDSVIADLFTGMYKSTLHCPECGKISITFDPFNNLTLPLPVEDVVCRTVKFYPLHDTPVKFEVELKKHSAIESLKQFISVRTGVPLNRLMGAEEFKGTFFKIYDNNQDASEEIGSSDIPAVHELEAAPTNWPGKGRKKYRSMLDIDTPMEAEWDDAKYDSMVVPVFHRRPESTIRGQDSIPPPHFIVLTREESRDIDLVRRKVLAKVATFTTWPKLTEAKEPESSQTPDTDMVLTDGDSSGDSKVVANSVEGEDDLVDVTMKGTTTSPPRNPAQVGILRRFETRRPALADPEIFLEPALQNLFELSYFANGDDIVPTGWQSFDNSKALPKLTDRIPETAQEEDDEDEDEEEDASPESWNSTNSGNEESGNEDASRANASQTRMLDESSEEEGSIQSGKFASRGGNQRGAHHGGPGGRKKFKGHKTYGKKGNKRRDKQMRSKQQHRMPAVKPQPTPPAVPDGGPLIRIGEGLVVDWKEDAWETVFGRAARDTESSQGAKTFVDLETVQDSALKINQRRRASRKSRGITLEECLDEFERAEILSEQDMWYCPRCKEHRRASKKFDLWKTPDILVAHLKRFSSSGWRRDKLDVLVDFPIEGLDLTSRVIQKEDGKEEVYDLIAVDDHYGGLGGGHYTAYGRNFADGKWYNYNDSHVSQVSDPSSMVTGAAYLLFYRRRSTKPLGGPRFADIFAKYGNIDEDDGSDSGNEQHVGSRNGSGTSTLTSRPSLMDRTSTRTTITPLTGPDEEEEEDDTLPSYSATEQVETIQDSIEDEGLDMESGYQTTRPKSLSMAQGWNFNGLGQNGDATDCASDDVQLGSSSSGRGASPDFEDQDTDMASVTGVQEEVETSNMRHTSLEGKGVLSVPPPGAKGGDESDEVTEIHLDGYNSN